VVEVSEERKPSGGRGIILHLSLGEYSIKAQNSYTDD
jgi:hypothetical protein